jgi:hypothetical protein
MNGFFESARIKYVLPVLYLFNPNFSRFGYDDAAQRF